MKLNSLQQNSIRLQDAASVGPPLPGERSAHGYGHAGTDLDPGQRSTGVAALFDHQLDQARRAVGRLAPEVHTQRLGVLAA